MSTPSDSDNIEPVKKRRSCPDSYKRNTIRRAKVKGLEHVNWKGRTVPARTTGANCK